MEFEKIPTKLSGLYRIILNTYIDERGTFTKLFQKSVFRENKFDFDYSEEYYSFSKRNVLRGLHFQIPPHEHTKIVHCIDGKILDVIVDIRKGSPTYGKYETFTLKGKDKELIYIPPGLAHGFLVLSKYAIVLYKTTTEYRKYNDRGILWNSIGLDWPVKVPIISKRDQDFPKLKSFNSPFIYNKDN